MTKFIEDLSPYFQDRCWMFVILAREANVGVILRRGPTEWWRATLWDTRRDTFEPGQWFRGRIYPEKCDISPNGKLFIYFAGKFKPRAFDKGYADTWTAVSRPPYLTALALWPMGGTYGGQGIFTDDRTILLGHCAPQQHHPNHPPGPLRLLDPVAFKKDPPPIPSWFAGWKGILPPNATSRYTEFRKPSGDLILGREAYYDSGYPSRRRTLYTLYRANKEPIALFEAHWADWDQRGRLVATVGGRAFTGKLTQSEKLSWRQLISTHEDQPDPMPAPAWAQRW